MRGLHSGGTPGRHAHDGWRPWHLPLMRGRRTHASRPDIPNAAPPGRAAGEERPDVPITAAYRRYTRPRGTPPAGRRRPWPGAPEVMTLPWILRILSTDAGGGRCLGAARAGGEFRRPPGLSRPGRLASVAYRLGRNHRASSPHPPACDGAGLDPVRDHGAPPDRAWRHWGRAFVGGLAVGRRPRFRRWHDQVAE